MSETLKLLAELDRSFAETGAGLIVPSEAQPSIAETTQIAVESWKSQGAVMQSLVLAILIAVPILAIVAFFASMALLFI